MNDGFFGTTAIPVVGPFITMTRVERDPNSYYLPSGKRLLIASGVAQIGFLVYFISTWAGEQSYNAEFSVIFFQTGLVIQCGIGLSNNLKLL